MRNTRSHTTKKEIPVSLQPSFIPKTGIKIFDEIGRDMVDNPPFQYDADIVNKFKSIGIGPDLTPSETANATIKHALLNGIEQGERLIDEKIRNLGAVVNGWSFNLDSGNYGTNYLLRAAIAKTALGANIAQEALRHYRKYQMEDWNLGLVLEQRMITQHSGGIHSE
jgi:hypothetical protein